MNKAIVCGRVGTDPEVRDFSNGVQLCTFTLATSESYKDKNGNKQVKTEWHRLQVWGQLSKVVREHVKKGSQILAEGKLSTRSYERNGNKQYVTEINVSNIKLLSSSASKPSQQEQQQRPAADPVDGNAPWSNPPSKQDDQAEFDFDCDNIPF